MCRPEIGSDTLYYSVVFILESEQINTILVRHIHQRLCLCVFNSYILKYYLPRV